MHLVQSRRHLGEGAVIPIIDETVDRDIDFRLSGT